MGMSLSPQNPFDVAPAEPVVRIRFTSAVNGPTEVFDARVAQALLPAARQQIIALLLADPTSTEVVEVRVPDTNELSVTLTRDTEPQPMPALESSVPTLYILSVNWFLPGNPTPGA